MGEAKEIPGTVIYILMNSNYWDDGIRGVFSSRELAQQAKTSENYGGSIKEYVLNVDEEE